MKKKIIIIMLMITVWVIVVWLFLNDKYSCQNRKYEEDIFEVKIETVKGEYIVPVNIAVELWMMKILEQYQQDVDILSEEQQKELWKAIAIVCRTNIVKRWLDNNCPDILVDAFDINKYNRKLKDESIIHKAEKETEGIVIIYDNNVIFAPFCYLTSGYTRNGCAYLVKKQCDNDMQNQKYIERKRYNIDQFWEIMDNLLSQNQKGEYKLKRNLEYIKYNRDDSEYVVSVNFLALNTLELNNELDNLSDKSDTSVINIPSKYICEAFDLHSLHFEVETCNDGKQIVIVTKGVGDGYGISLNQALYLATQEYSYEYILHFFYSEVELERKW